MYILCSYNKPQFGHFNSLVLRSFIENRLEVMRVLDDEF